MIKHDLTHWPLVVTVLRGVPTLEDQQDLFSMMDAALDRGEFFATLRVYADEDALARPQGSGQESKAWFQNNGERLKSLVLGMATVMPANRVEERNKVGTQKMTGSPAMAFGDVAQAVDWLASEVFAPKGIQIDSAAINQAVTAL